MNTNLEDVKAKINEQAKWIKWGIGIAVIIVTGIVGYFVIKSLIMLGIIIFLALALVNFAPVVEMKFKNAKLKAIKDEAAKNPIETLQNVHLEKTHELKLRADKIQKFGAKVERYSEQKDQFAADFPGDVAKFDKIEKDMRALLARRHSAWQAAKKDLDRMESEIRRAGAIWAMSLASADLQEEAGQLEANFMQRIKTETAFDAVSDSLANSMSSLDRLMMEQVDMEVKTTESQPLILENNPSNMLGITDVLDVSKSTVERRPVTKEV